MSKKITIILLFIILCIGSVFRLYKLGEIPPSPDWDETALGYNAYSILKTGKDEYGKFLPLTFRSFDDYKPPLYVYLTIPSVAVFGLNNFSVRLPSALMGIIGILFVYLFTRELLRLRGKTDTCIPLIVSLLFAISPWDIQYSRIAFETHIGTVLNIIGAYLFLKGRKNTPALALSAFIFGIALYAYHSERFFAPVLVIILTLATYKEVFADKKRVVIACIVGIITVLPLISVFMDKNTFMRLRGTSLFADQNVLLSRSINKLETDIQAGDAIGRIFDNRRFVFVQTVWEGYISHFSLKWLFLTGDQGRHHAPDMGLLYLWELPFLLIGIREIWKRGGSIAFILFGWFLMAPIPAAASTGLPHATRTLVFLPTFQIFVAFGITAVLDWIRNNYQRTKSKEQMTVKKIVFSLVCAVYGVAIVFNIIYYIQMYFIHMNTEYSVHWQYGYKEAVRYAEANKFKYRKIVVSIRLEQPHMFFLYYTKYDPAAYLSSGGTASGGFEERNNKFDIYEFRQIQWDKEVSDPTVMYIGLPSEIIKPNVATIRYLDGSPAIYIAVKN